MTVEITVLGLVQGVGYRPFVARLARELDIGGQVRNTGGIVRIIADGEKEAVDSFVHRLQLHAPPGAEVRQILVSPLQEQHFTDFTIVASTSDSDEIPFIPPDLPLCEDCLRELYNPTDRRFGYPLISCVACGPRYSIIQTLPYDRGTTVMTDYVLCPACEKEYTAENDRRRHAQTISCHDCGPQLILQFSDHTLHRDEALKKGIELIKQGKVLAVKGIGGYHFACLPTYPEAVEALRSLKQRDKKPFAVLFPSVESIQEICRVSLKEEKLLLTPARPIVLLEKTSEAFYNGVSGESRFIGAFLPYTPLQRLLADACGRLVMTSANLSGQPVITDDQEMLSLSSPDLAGVLVHTRRILTPLDDTVMRVVDNSPQMIRRSRGVTPLPIELKGIATRPVLAMGGDLKSAFCLLAGNRAILSQYFGDLEDYAVTQKCRQALTRMEALFGIHPTSITCDLHPGYVTTRLAKSIAEERGMLLMVQHHHAHVASVMAEHGLSSCIGVAFDGTGYGTDGAVWGGEFLLCKGRTFERSAHLEYVTLCGGDAGMKNAGMTADCYRISAGIEWQGSEFQTLRAAVEKGINTHPSSSMGRLFDAVSALLEIRNRNSYEGEAAIALENAAAAYEQNGGKPYPLHFKIKQTDGVLLVDQTGLFQVIGQAKQKGVDTGALALGFHSAVAEMVMEVCMQIREQTGETNIALSGGVFANLLLTEDCIDRLSNAGFKVYLNRQVPTNDGGICLGQAFLTMDNEF